MRQIGRREGLPRRPGLRSSAPAPLWRRRRSRRPRPCAPRRWRNPLRAGRSLTWNEPKSGRMTVSPCFNVSLSVAWNALIAVSAYFLDMPVLSDMASISCFLFIIPISPFCLVTGVPTIQPAPGPGGAIPSVGCASAVLPYRIDRHCPAPLV